MGFKGYIYYTDPLARIPCRKWACNVCGITGLLVSNSLDDILDEYCSSQGSLRAPVKEDLLCKNN